VIIFYIVISGLGSVASISVLIGLWRDINYKKRMKLKVHQQLDINPLIGFSILSVLCASLFIFLIYKHVTHKEDKKETKVKTEEMVETAPKYVSPIDEDIAANKNAKLGDVRNGCIDTRLKEKVFEIKGTKYIRVVHVCEERGMKVFTPTGWERMIDQQWTE